MKIRSDIREIINVTDQNIETIYTLLAERDYLCMQGSSAENLNIILIKDVNNKIAALYNGQSIIIYKDGSFTIVQTAILNLILE